MSVPLRTFGIALVFLTVGLSGCLEDAEQEAAEQPPPIKQWSAGPPALVDPNRYGYEPRVLEGPGGTLYATAHPVGNPEPGGQVSSWLRYSTDGGATWSDVGGADAMHGRFAGLEGDIAFDDMGRLFFVDTLAAELWLHVFDAADGVPKHLSSRPVGTIGVDDRPWLAARGDGELFLLLNNGEALVAPENAVRARFWLLRSTDAGGTWSPGYGFPLSDWCTIASGGPAGVVAIACSRAVEGRPIEFVSPARTEAVVFLSHDGGKTFEEHVLFDLTRGFTEGFPSVAVRDDGLVVTSWVEGTGSGFSGAVRVAWQTPAGDWEELSVAPVAAEYSMGWIAAAGDIVAVACYVRPTTASSGLQPGSWYPYVVAWEVEDTWTLAWNGTVAERPASDEALPPGDFLAHDVGADGVVHVVWEEELPAGSDPLWAVGDVWYAQVGRV